MKMRDKWEMRLPVGCESSLIPRKRGVNKMRVGTLRGLRKCLVVDNNSHVVNTTIYEVDEI